ncbi:histidinol-phosphate transaminase [Paradevosia shaoguanensis]|uniref:histidinol-phosphate transaminase n=1 Tax=Paradevosia shaoguanensis TaxID=1335043 RepID=UPI0019317A0E|nr:histidinol-phosphate transaminase [Paradevosia shaoguanensis]
MSDRPVPRPGLLTIAPYVPGRSQAAPGVAPVKLSANESPLGTSPRALHAFNQAVSEGLEIYPEGTSKHLRVALGEVNGLDPDQILCGNGSDDILHLLAQSFLDVGHEAIMSRYGFSVYPIITAAAGATLVVAEETDYTADVDAMLAAVTERTKMVFLANPNNPTGTYLPAAELERLHRGLRPDILLVIDSAYADFVTAGDYTAGIELVDNARNVVMVRTFSKIGLAAARVGWMYGRREIVDLVNRIRSPFNLNRPAQYAAAEAARDIEFNTRLREYNADWRDWLTQSLNSNEMRVVPSQGNFILLLFPDAARASAAFQALYQQGLIVREVGDSYGIPNGLRISIGPEDAMRRVVGILKDFGGRP